jgi:hypothetical protein
MGSEKVHIGYGGETWRKEPVGKPRSRWKDKNKVNLREERKGDLGEVHFVLDSTTGSFL